MLKCSGEGIRLVFAIPGDLGTLTGGYRYDREVIRHLPDLGIDAVHLQLRGSFPHAGALDLDDAVCAINAAVLPKGLVLVDGLAFGALTEKAIGAIKAPIVALCHHPLGLEAGLKPQQSRALLASEKTALALAARVIVTSASTARTLQLDFDVPARRISLASPGTDSACRAQGSGGPLSFLAVGSITPRKAFDILIAALAGLKDLHWRLKIAGGARQSPETAEALAMSIEAHGLNRRVQCLGELQGAALEDAFHRSDAFVSSSLYEGYGMALAEAMARGLPIVTTTGGAAAETVPDAAALKVPPGNPAALREALRLMILDRSLRQRLSDGAWAAGQLLPSWRNTAEAIARVVKDVAAAPA